MRTRILALLLVVSVASVADARRWRLFGRRTSSTPSVSHWNGPRAINASDQAFAEMEAQYLAERGITGHPHGSPMGASVGTGTGTNTCGPMGGRRTLTGEATRCVGVRCRTCRVYR